MKKKLFIILGVLVLSITILFSYIVKDNKEENNKEISKVEKLLSKPAGIQAYTLNGEKTDKTFDEMVNYYVIDTITCQNGSVATYNQSDNTVTMTNVHIPEYCVMNFKPGTYTLTIDPNGGYRASDNDSSVMKVNYQYGHVEIISERKKDGYALIGYEMFNTDTGSADDVKGSKFEFDSSTNIGTFTQGAANITLKATWGTNTYKVTLDNQGATTAGTAEVYYQYNTTNTINGVTCYYYTDVTLKSCVTNGTTITVPTKAGYTFEGYYSGTNGTGTQYVDSKGVFMNNIYKTTGSKTLYAKWTVNKYKLTLTKGTGIGTIYYKINGASTYTSTTVTATLSVNYGSTYYYYGVASTGYTYTACTASKPCSAKMGTTAVSQTLTGTINTYKVTLAVVGGTGATSKNINYNGSGSFTSVSPSTNYTATGATVSCNGGASASLSGTTVTVSKVLKAQTCTVTFKKIVVPLYNQLLADNPTIKTRTAFNTVFTETNTGTLYKTTESIANSAPKDVYYFAGNSLNNWVKFGGFYWRIIRTNHDGSIRLLYSGTSPDTTSGYIGTSAFNSSSNNPKYVGYMYGTGGSLANDRLNTTDSTIKGIIDSWYNNNLSSYTKYISTEAVYCNDRELTPGAKYYKTHPFNYATIERLNTNKTPTYDCTNIKDAFSGSNSEAKLTYPIGLMTADEIAYAGGVKGTNAPAWYYLNSAGGSITGSTWWWSLSPSGWNSRYSNVWCVFGSDNPSFLSDSNVNDSYGARPAISIKSCALWSSGNGSSSSPYEINGGC
mgnify:CR=1 FL=1